MPTFSIIISVWEQSKKSTRLIGIVCPDRLKLGEYLMKKNMIMCCITFNYKKVMNYCAGV